MTLAIEDLRAVGVIVCHENGPGNACPDGTASAILLRDALPLAKIVFASHQGEAMRALEPRPGLLFCDVTPPRDRCSAFAATGAIVLDHHEKQRDDVALFGERGIYSGEPGVSGALLALRNVWIPIQYARYRHDVMAVAQEMTSTFERAQRFAMLAGVRDTWQKNDSRWCEACEQAEALRFWPWDRLDGLGFEADSALPQFMAIGPVLFEKRSSSVKHLAAEAYRFETKRGTKIVIIHSTDTSDVAEFVDADVLVGFRYYFDPGLGQIMLSLSFRSRSTYDVGALAQSIGGGGHRAAAGTKIEADNSMGPYMHVARILREHEEGPITTWVQASGFAAFDAVKRMSGCGQTDEAQEKVCLLSKDHVSPHGWEHPEELRLLAREVLENKTQSHVGAAATFARYILGKVP